MATDETELLDIYLAVVGPEGGWVRRSACLMIADEVGSEEHHVESSGGYGNRNSYALSLVINALKSLDENIQPNQMAMLHVNCGYVVKGLNQWIPAWKRNGWITKSGRPVGQRAQWELLQDLVQKTKTTLIHLEPGPGRTADESYMTHCANLAVDELNSGSVAVRAPDPTPSPKMKSGPAAAPAPMLEGQGMW